MQSVLIWYLIQWVEKCRFLGGYSANEGARISFFGIYGGPFSAIGGQPIEMCLMDLWEQPDVDEYFYSFVSVYPI